MPLAFALFAMQSACDPSGRFVGGVVTDCSSATSLVGVSVTELDFGNVEQTGSDGRYSIEVGARSDRLQFDKPGYETEVRTVGEGDVLDVCLTPTDSGAGGAGGN